MNLLFMFKPPHVVHVHGRPSYLVLGEGHGVEECWQLAVAFLDFRQVCQVVVPPVHEQHSVDIKGMALNL